MGGALTGIRLSWRIAAREAWRNRIQSVLIIVLIVVPVAATTSIITVAESAVATREEMAAIWLGASAQASLEVVSPPDQSLTQDALKSEDWRVAEDESGERLYSDPRRDEWQEPADVLPSSTSILPIAESYSGIVAETNAGRGRFVYVEGEVWNSSLDGAYRVTTGRAPAAEGEVLVTDSALDRFGIAVGDIVTVREPAAVALTVVGTVDDATKPDAVNAIYAAPGTIPAATTQLYSQRYVLPDLALSWSQVQDLNQSGIVVLSRTVLADPPDGPYRQLYDPSAASFGLVILVGLFATFGIVILASAAFAIGARRKQHSLALIASTGASRGTLFRIVATDGLVLGATGAVSGLVAGIGVAFVWLYLHNDGDRLAYPGFHLSPASLAVVAVVAVTASGLAAIVPAVAASRVDAMQALRTADRPPTRPRRTHFVGLPLVALGVAAVVACGIGFSTTAFARGKATPGVTADVGLLVNGAALGAVAVLIGTVLILPLLLRGIRRVLATSTLSVRLAAHDIAADTRRTAPIIAVMLVMVTVATMTVSVASYLEQQIRSTAVIEALPGRIVIALVGPDTVEQTPAEAAAIADEALDIVERNFDVAEAHVLQRPAQDWTTYFDFDFDNGAATYIRALPSEGALCPLSDGTAFSGAAEYEQALDDPRCGPDSLSLRVLFTGYGATTPSILIGDADDLSFVADTSVSTQQRAFLNDGGALAFWPHLVTADKTVTVATEIQENGNSVRTTDSATLPAQVLNDSQRLWHHIFISPETATSIGLTPVAEHLLVSLKATPTQEQLDAAWAELNALVPGVGQVSLVRDPTAEPRLAALTTLALAFSITLAAGLLALGLGWVEGSRERRTLWTLGASPTTVRFAQAGQVWLLTTVAALLGTVIGLFPVIALLGPTDTGFNPSWATILTTIIGFPLVLAATAAIIPMNTAE
ncbi:FtsX-like permease family protein [Cryobacterium sp. Y57]|uniref:ABC transporter permease n=1 Tax=Cryobacterium sp. Y57 TaxID=2048287 RepID=UPI000CE50B5C|nr:FtsX-like permease family protein [Cryobacterium sp. Y57]